MYLEEVLKVIIVQPCTFLMSGVLVVLLPGKTVKDDRLLGIVSNQDGEGCLLDLPDPVHLPNRVNFPRP